MGPSLVEALMPPTACPVEERPHRVELVETHASYLFRASQFLTGRCVYKVKKPVDLGFLDLAAGRFTTLEKRRHYPHPEVLRRDLTEVYTPLLSRPGQRIAA